MDLSEIAKLTDNWDGQGAAAPSAETIRTAEDFLRGCRPPDHCRPTPDGCIALEWSYPWREVEIDGEHIELVK